MLSVFNLIVSLLSNFPKTDRVKSMPYNAKSKFECDWDDFVVRLVFFFWKYNNWFLINQLWLFILMCLIIIYLSSPIEILATLNWFWKKFIFSFSFISFLEKNQSIFGKERLNKYNKKQIYYIRSHKTPNFLLRDFCHFIIL